MNALEELTSTFSQLPGIGKKSAARISAYILKKGSLFANTLAKQLQDLHERMRFCSICGSYTEDDPCPICSDPARDRSLLCVVEQPQDVRTIEATKEYRGLFHVLGGVISPLEGVGPDQLSFAALLNRLKNESVNEVIIATNPTVEGDTTALFIQRMLRDTNVTVTRLASGLPAGGDLEYADRLTLSRSIRGRTTF